MGRRFDPAAAMDDIVSSFPPGHFDQAEPLLRAYVEKLGEHDDLLVLRDEAMDRGDLSPATLDLMEDLMERSVTALDEALDLAEALGVLPGDGRKRPAPRLN